MYRGTYTFYTEREKVRGKERERLIGGGRDDVISRWVSYNII